MSNDLTIKTVFAALMLALTLVACGPAELNEAERQYVRQLPYEHVALRGLSDERALELGYSACEEIEVWGTTYTEGLTWEGIALVPESDTMADMRSDVEMGGSSAPAGHLFRTAYEWLCPLAVYGS